MQAPALAAAPAAAPQHQAQIVGPHCLLQQAADTGPRCQVPVLPCAFLGLALGRAQCSPGTKCCTVRITGDQRAKVARSAQPPGTKTAQGTPAWLTFATAAGAAGQPGTPRLSPLLAASLLARRPCALVAPIEDSLVSRALQELLQAARPWELQARQPERQAATPQGQTQQPQDQLPGAQQPAPADPCRAAEPLQPQQQPDAPAGVAQRTAGSGQVPPPAAAVRQPSHAALEEMAPVELSSALPATAGLLPTTAASWFPHADQLGSRTFPAQAVPLPQSPAQPDAAESAQSSHLESAVQRQSPPVPAAAAQSARPAAAEEQDPRPDSAGRSAEQHRLRAPGRAHLDSAGLAGVLQLVPAIPAQQPPAQQPAEPAGAPSQPPAAPAQQPHPPAIPSGRTAASEGALLARVNAHVSGAAPVLPGDSMGMPCAWAVHAQPALL